MNDDADYPARERKALHQILDLLLDAHFRARKPRPGEDDDVDACAHESILEDVRRAIADPVLPEGKILAPAIAVVSDADPFELMRVSQVIMGALHHLAGTIAGSAVEAEVAHRVADAAGRAPKDGADQPVMESAVTGGAVASDLLRSYGATALGSTFALTLAEAFEALSLGVVRPIFQPPRKRGQGDVAVRPRLEHLAVAQERALHFEFGVTPQRARGQVAVAYNVKDETIRDWAAANGDASGARWRPDGCTECARRRLNLDIERCGKSYRKARPRPARE
jgi:hypothetical protein